MKRKGILSVLALFLSFSITPSVDAAELDVMIRLYNEEIYFPDSDIHIHVQLQNNSSESIQFRIADDRLFNLDFHAVGMDNRPLERTDEFTIRRTTNQVFFRTVVLQPGERFSFVEPLTEYVSFPDPAIYTVRAHFFPDLARSAHATPVLSNAITVAIRPGFSAQVRQEMRFEAITQQELQRTRLGPDEIIATTFDALRQNNWDQFFLNLNLEKIYRQAPERDRRFRALSEEQQLEEIRRFRASLMSAPNQQDAELVNPPDDFEIVETRYTPTEGRVVVNTSYDFNRFRERKRYTFRFERRNGFWEIIGYHVDNLPNEPINR